MSTCVENIEMIEISNSPDDFGERQIIKYDELPMAQQSSEQTENYLKIRHSKAN